MQPHERAWRMLREGRDPQAIHALTGLPTDLIARMSRDMERAARRTPARDRSRQEDPAHERNPSHAPA